MLVGGSAKPRLTARGIVHNQVFEGFSRAGFVARGLVYGIVGVLAMKLALGAGGKTTDQQGALRTVAHEPFGRILLILVAVGLAGYALWRFVHAAVGRGPESRDSGFDRVVALASGCVYGALAVVAVTIVAGSGGGSSSGTSRRVTAGVLGWPGGTTLVELAGAGFVAVALFQGYRGVSMDFLDDSKTELMSPATRRSIAWIGMVGYLARMVVFALVGIFLIKAAVEFDPRTAVGLDGALAKLTHRSYGPGLLGVVAAGLIAFALYSFSDARYRRI
jgi:Domain of Unknown Function (DUF1206)